MRVRLLSAREIKRDIGRKKEGDREKPNKYLIKNINKNIGIMIIHRMEKKKLI